MTASVLERPHYTAEDKTAVDRMLSLIQTGGQSASVAIDRDFLLQDGNANLFFLNYFGPDFTYRWEPINQRLVDFLENEREGMWWLPGGHGKDLDCDTPILTITNGWRTMGTVEVGDEVFGPDGQPTRVSYVSEVFHNHPCYKLTFSDGAEIVAGEDHLWWVWDEYGHNSAAYRAHNGEKYKGSWMVMSTKEMASKKWVRVRGKQKSYRFHVRFDAVLDAPEAKLPIDPYILGYWLGDGHSSCACITVGENDCDHICAEIERAGYNIVRKHVDSRTGAITIAFNMFGKFDSDGFMPRARSLGVLNNKHIPTDYLLASREQRIALLAGLVDSDGTIYTADRGHGRKLHTRVEFSVCSAELADGVHQLLRSLGIRTTCKESDAVIRGRVVGKRYRINWVPTFNPFRLPRKAERYREPEQSPKLMSICGIEQVQSRPTRCIQVDNPEHVYLVGRLFTPTHNTTTILRWIIYVITREPQISFIYIEKNEPTAMKRSNAVIGQLESNRALIHDFGDFKGDLAWSAKAWTVRQRPNFSDWPTFSCYGTKGGALGNRCNILIADDLVTTENSDSELERNSIESWWSQAASTCPYPLPLTKHDRYLRKLFIGGTVFHMDDLYHRILRRDPDFKLLHLPAVDHNKGTLSPRFSYIDNLEEAKKQAETDPYTAQLLDDIHSGKVIDLYSFKVKKGTVAFNQRYMNRVSDPSLQKFPEVWFRGGTDDSAPVGGYPGCLDETAEMGAAANPNWKYVTGFDPQSGSSTRDAARFVSVTLGADPKNPTDIYLVDLDYGKYALESDNPERQTQCKVILEQVRRYGSVMALETNGVQAVYAGVIRKAAQAQGMTVTIRQHWTSKKGKLDPEIGIEAMQPMIENGKLHIPYFSPSDKRKADELIEEFVNWGVYPTKDIVMAFWFAWRVLQRSLKQFSAQSHHNEKLPVWREYRPDLIFPDFWTPAQRKAYLTGKPADVEEEDEEL